MNKLELRIKKAIENERNNLFVSGLFLTKRVRNNKIMYQIECSKSAFIRYFYAKAKEIPIADYMEILRCNSLLFDSILIKFKGADKNDR